MGWWPGEVGIAVAYDWVMEDGARREGDIPASLAGGEGASHAASSGNSVPCRGGQCQDLRCVRRPGGSSGRRGASGSWSWQRGPARGGLSAVRKPWLFL